MAISDHIAVMNEGKIVQLGTAEELYLQPNSSFVARFIGKINPLPAVVKESSQGRVIVELLHKNFPVVSQGMEFQAGQKVSVFIRPESLVLTKEVQKGQFRGIIRERTFLGEKVDYLLEIDGHQLSAASYDPLTHGTFSPQEEVGVLFDSRAIKVLREEGKAQ